LNNFDEDIFCWGGSWYEVGQVGSGADEVVHGLRSCDQKFTVVIYNCSKTNCIVSMKYPGFNVDLLYNVRKLHLFNVYNTGLGLKLDND